MAPRAALGLLAALIAAAAIGAVVPASAAAAEFRSVGPDPAVLYDAPTTRGRKVGIGPRGMPVEVVVNEGDWVRVRDQSGEMSWVQKTALVDKHMLVATLPTTARTQPDEHAPPAFRLQTGVEVEFLDGPTNGFVHVRHRDGSTGWVRVSEVWGL